MNKKSRISLIVLLSVILLMALTIPVQATNMPYAMHIKYTLNDVDWDDKSAEGEFEIVDPDPVRVGTVTLDWIARTQVKQGTMYLTEDGGPGTLVIGFSIPVKPAGDYCGTGSFKILTDLSPGYEVFGTGTIEMCRVGNGPHATIEGQLWGSAWTK